VRLSRLASGLPSVNQTSSTVPLRCAAWWHAHPPGRAIRGSPARPASAPRRIAGYTAERQHGFRASASASRSRTFSSGSE
jgi:hypothetical protein